MGLIQSCKKESAWGLFVIREGTRNLRLSPIIVSGEITCFFIRPHDNTIRMVLVTILVRESYNRRGDDLKQITAYLLAKVGRAPVESGLRSPA